MKTLKITSLPFAFNYSLLGVAFWFFILVLLFSTGCETVRGYGDVITETRAVGTFTAVEAGGSVDVLLTQGPAQPLRLEGQDNILDVLETSVRNNELVVRFKPGVILRRHKPVRLYVTLPVLTAVNVNGSADVTGQTDFRVDDLRLSVSGSGNLEMALRDGDDLDTDISGSGNIRLRGNAATNDIHISGSGNVRSFDLALAEANVQVSGSGNCELSVRQKLTARVSGSGNIRYKGRPSVDSRVTGSGRVVGVD